MEKLIKAYSFRLQTKHAGAAIVEVCSLSVLCDVPLEFTKIVMVGNGEDCISFRLLMNELVKDMMVKIFFQMQSTTEVRMLDNGKWQILKNPLSVYVDDNNFKSERKYMQGLN